jgi:hypothetical protein
MAANSSACSRAAYVRAALSRAAPACSRLPRHDTHPLSHNPDFGKNWARTFTNPKCPITGRYGDGFARMAALQAKYDPTRAFEPELWRRMVAGEKFFLKPRCQLDRTCYCEEDIHCAEGFSCRPSHAFPEFKTCQPTVMN